MQDPFYNPSAGIGATLTTPAIAGSYTASITAQAFDMTGTLILPVGIWLVTAQGVGYCSVNPNTGLIAPVITIRNTTDLTDVIVSSLLCTNASTPAAGDSNYFQYSLIIPVTCAKPTSIKVIGGSVGVSGSPTTGGYGSRPANGSGIVAVKIANV